MKKKVWVIIGILILALIGYGLYNYAYNTGYDNAYDNGYEDGYDEGYETGYDEGYSDSEWDHGENDLSGYIPPNNTNTYLTTDTAPAGTVWTTPSGEKYHEPWCRYISGRNDLTYFYTSSDAANAGYSPCSVCH